MSRLGESGESGGAFEPSTVQANLMIDPKTEPRSGVFIKQGEHAAHPLGGSKTILKNVINPDSHLKS